MAGTTASEVANYLIWLAAHERPEARYLLAPIHIQKLLFYIQGWSLIEMGGVMFGEPIEAWTEGPVVDAVYQQFKNTQRNRLITAVPENEPNLSPSDREMVRAVWSAYRKYAWPTLVDMTHDDPAWIKARGNLPRDQPSKVKIHQDVLKRSFEQKVAGIGKRLSANWSKFRDAATANTQRLTGRPAL